MNILILINDESTIINFRMELIERLISTGFQVGVSSPYGERLHVLEKMGCLIHPIRMKRRGTSPFDEVRLLFSYIRLLKKQKPSFILTYTVKPNIYGGIASRILRTPQIATITGLGDAVSNPGLLQQIVMGLSKFSFKKTKTIFFQNSSNLQLYVIKKIVKKSQSRLISGSGVNLEKYSYSPYRKVENNVVQLVYIGRVLKDKGIAELILGLEKLYSDKVNITCDLIGPLDDESFSPLIAGYVNKGIGKYLGIRNDIPAILPNYHAVILPSYHEGMANVLLEAAASGRPILATNIPGCRETFDEGISGFGFEPRSVDSLVQAIKRFIDLSHEQKAAMGLAGRKKMELEFDRQIVVDAYIREIEKILDENTKKGRKK